VVLCRGEDRKRLLFSEEKRSKKDFIYLGWGHDVAHWGGTMD
jgi:hypothetical protein